MPSTVNCALSKVLDKEGNIMVRLSKNSSYVCFISHAFYTSCMFKWVVVEVSTKFVRDMVC